MPIMLDLSIPEHYWDRRSDLPQTPPSYCRLFVHLFRDLDCYCELDKHLDTLVGDRKNEG